MLQLTEPTLEQIKAEETFVNKQRISPIAYYVAKARLEEREKIKKRGLTRLSAGKTIICLCGSTRFNYQMLLKQWELTKQGHIVLSWCSLPDSYAGGGDHIGDLEGVKQIVDEVHKRKIDLCNEVLVLNIDGYIGNSTRSEINYALEHNKPVRYLIEKS